MDALQLANEFALAAPPVSARAWAGGHINTSWKVDCADGAAILLQGLNPDVFPNSVGIMQNLKALLSNAKNFETPATGDLKLILTTSGQAWHTDSEGKLWRAFSFLPHTRTFLEAQSPAHAFLASKAFGQFLHEAAQMDIEKFQTVLPEFHNTPARIKALQVAAQTDAHHRVATCQDEIQAVLDYLPTARDLHQTPFPVRIVHNDAKIANILFDESGEKVHAVIDLDTTQPGCALHDYSDMLRSMTCLAAEDCADLSQVVVDPDLVSAVRCGWLEGCGGLLTDIEIEHMPRAASWIATELGARFLTDYLNGDAYFNITRPRQNLDRARVQLHLASQLARLQR